MSIVSPLYAGVDLGRDDALVMDAPISFHWPKLLLWGAVEGLLAAASALQIHGGRAAVKAAKASGADCRAGIYHFPPNTALTAVQSVLVAVLALYLIGVIAHLGRAFAELRKRSYKRYRVANTLVRVQVRGQCTLCLRHQRASGARARFRGIGSSVLTDCCNACRLG